MTFPFDPVILEKIGIAGICFAVIFFGFKIFKLVLNQWQSSTEALNRNTDAFKQHTELFAKQAEREVEFQKDVIHKLDVGQTIMHDTNKKVTEIHRKIH